jgi:hypothetical protein
MLDKKMYPETNQGGCRGIHHHGLWVRPSRRSARREGVERCRVNEIGYCCTVSVLEDTVAEQSFLVKTTGQ